MELIIKDEHAGSLHAALGISEKRSDEICIFMNRISDAIKLTGQVNFSKNLKRIADFCNNTEELVFAVSTHTRWLEIHGCFNKQKIID